MPGSSPFCFQFPQILGEPCVSGNCFSKHTEKSPIGIYLITINRCITLASMRQLLDVLISSPAYGNAGQSAGPAAVPLVPEPALLLSMPTPRGTGLSRCRGRLGRMVMEHYPCLRYFPHRIPFIPSTSVSPVSPLQLCVMCSRRQDCWMSLTSRLDFGDFPPQFLAECSDIL